MTVQSVKKTASAFWMAKEQNRTHLSQQCDEKVNNEYLQLCPMNVYKIKQSQ